MVNLLSVNKLEKASALLLQSAVLKAARMYKASSKLPVKRQLSNVPCVPDFNTPRLSLALSPSAPTKVLLLMVNLPLVCVVLSGPSSSKAVSESPP